MKRSCNAVGAAAVLAGLAGLILSTASAAAGSGLLAQAPMTQGPLGDPRLMRRPLPEMQYHRRLRECPDPAVTGLDFAIVSRTARFRGRVEITATVDNVGRATYSSRPNQQSVQLYEATPGGPSRLVAQTAFVNLAPGEGVKVSYTRNWYAASPAEGEFPPTYRAIIAYDPDITMDGNPRNDDCVAANNRRERSGADINAMFR
jgi:hypothetical protein